MNVEDKRFYLVATRMNGEDEWKVNGMPMNSLIDAEVYKREQDYYIGLYDCKYETKIFVTGQAVPVAERKQNGENNEYSERLRDDNAFS